MKMFRNLSIFVLAFLSILVVSFYGCQKEGAQVSPKVDGTADLQVETRGGEPLFFSIYPEFHGDVVASLYIKRARLDDFPKHSSTYTSKLLSKLQVPTGTEIQKQLATDLWQNLKNTNTYKTPLTVPFNDTKCIIYRGGGTIDASNQYKKYTDKKTNQVMVVGATTLNTTGLKANGPSFNVDPNNTNILTYGGAFKIESAIPSDLTFIQQGQDVGHFVLVPKNDMLESTYLSKIAQVTSLKQSF
jgi:hypothetical protein